MTPPRMHHVQVAIPAGGEDTARRFYNELLDPRFTPATKAHVALEVEDIVSLRDRGAAAGFLTIDDEPLPGYERFYVDDPFGIRTEILQLTSEC